MPQIGYAHRPVALGTRGMVAAAHPLATLAGIETLKSGGTAADAAVAVNGVLAVTQPNSCGLGGDLFCLYYEAATGRVHFLNGSGRSGARASLDELARRGWSRLPVIGPPTVSVPGCVRGWAMLLERFGTRPLGELLRPAISAADGFSISSLVSQAIDEYASVTPDPEWHRVFAPGGRAPARGGAALGGVRGAPAHAVRPGEGAVVCVRRPRGGHDGIRRRRPGRQRRQRDPEPLQRVRRRRRRAGHGRDAPESWPALQPRPGAPRRAGAAQTPLPQAHGGHRHAGRPARAGVCDDGRQRPGDVPRAGAHQRLRLRHGHPGSDRTTAFPDRRVPARRAGGHDPHRGARPRPRRRRTRAAGTPREEGARVLHPGRSRPRDRPARRHAHGRRRSARRRRGAGVLAVRGAAAGLLVLLALAARPTGAADWGLRTPGTTTLEAVRARYGQPTKTTPKKVDDYD